MAAEPNQSGNEKTKREGSPDITFLRSSSPTTISVKHAVDTMKEHSPYVKLPTLSAKQVSSRNERYSPYKKPSRKIVYDLEEKQYVNYSPIYNSFDKRCSARRPRVKSFNDANNSPIVILGSNRNKQQSGDGAKSGKKTILVDFVDRKSVSRTSKQARLSHWKHSVPQQTTREGRSKPLLRRNSIRNGPSPKKQLKRRPSVRTLSNKPLPKYETMGAKKVEVNEYSNRRKHSVVSTKVRKHSSGGHLSPGLLGQISPVKRGLYNLINTKTSLSKEVLLNLSNTKFV